MKRIPVLFVCLLFFALSCKKSDKLSVPPGVIQPPPMPNMAGVSSYLQNTTIRNVWGIMEAITVRGNYISSAGLYIPIYANNASAHFGNGHAGTVSVNNVILDTTFGVNGYGLLSYINASPYTKDSLNFNVDDNWKVSGNGNVPSISFNYTGAFPSFYGTLPVSIKSTDGFSITFDASNNSDADSAFIYICTSEGHGFASSIVSAHGGTATLGSYNIPAANFGAVTYLEIFLSRYTTKVFGNKQFAFVKINEFIQNVTIN